MQSPGNSCHTVHVTGFKICQTCFQPLTNKGLFNYYDMFNIILLTDKRGNMKTIFAKNTDVVKKWHVIDAEGLVVGRLASRVASILRGKNKPIYTPHVDTGDFVIIINAEKVRFTGNKLQQKAYYHHSGYPGGIKKRIAEDVMKDFPERIITSAIRGMLPKNTLGRYQLGKLKVYRGPEHPHKAQNPETLNLNIQ